MVLMIDKQTSQIGSVNLAEANIERWKAELKEKVIT